MKKMFLFVFIGLFLFGCINNSEQPPPVEEVEDEVITPPKEVEKVPKINFIEFPLELNAKDGSRFLIEVKEVPNVQKNIYLYIWDEPSNPSKYPADYVLSSDTFVQLSSNKEHYESYITIDEPGKYYARVLVIHNGEYYWSEEINLNVLTMEGKIKSTYNVHINYDTITPENIVVNKGEIIVINFKAMEDSHSNGARIVSPMWKDSPVLKPGESFSVQFVADKTFDYRMFWLAGNLLKTTGTVTVN